jgi:hypothetical protein
VNTAFVMESVPGYVSPKEFGHRGDITKPPLKRPDPALDSAQVATNS